MLAYVGLQRNAIGERGANAIGEAVQLNPMCLARCDLRDNVVSGTLLLVCCCYLLLLLLCL
jgi:hypothetical protein